MTPSSDCTRRIGDTVVLLNRLVEEAFGEESVVEVVGSVSVGLNDPFSDLNVTVIDSERDNDDLSVLVEKLMESEMIEVVLCTQDKVRHSSIFLTNRVHRSPEYAK